MTNSRTIAFALLITWIVVLMQINISCEASERKRLHGSKSPIPSKSKKPAFFIKKVTYKVASELLTWDGQESTQESEAVTPSIAFDAQISQIDNETIDDTFSTAPDVESTPGANWSSALVGSFSAIAQFDVETEQIYASFQASLSNQDMFISNKPFIVCNSMTNMSGYSRTYEICSLLNISEASCESVTTISNTINATCSIFQTTTDAIEYTARSSIDLIFLPLLPSLKMRKGIVDAITTKNATQFDIDLCDTNTTAESVFSELTLQLWQNGVPKRTRSLLSRILGNNNGLFKKKTGYLCGDQCDTSGFSKRLSLFRRSLEAFNSTECSAIYKGIKMTSKDSTAFRIQISAEDYPSQTNDSIISLCTLNVIQLIAANPQVCSVDFARKIVLSATSSGNIGPNNVNWITQSNKQYFLPWFQAGLTGSGQVIGVSDSGIDTDNCYFANSDGSSVMKDGNIYPNNRKIIQYYPYVDGQDGNEGHGTAVASTIAGKRFGLQGMADGVAPDAKIAFFDIGDDSDPNTGQCCNIPSDFNVFLNKSRSAGAKIQNISWGTVAINNYISLDRMLDNFIYNDQESIIIVAAGNSGPGPNTVVSPALAKNIITVGAHHGAGQDLYPGQYGRNYLAFFSSNGPSSDGRVKPDIVAPGLSVLNARALPLQTGECDPSGINLSAGQGIDGVNYRYGTSFAAPVVSGMAALVRQYFMEGFYPTGLRNSSNLFLPSGQLIKATLLNGAQPLVGYQPFNFDTGAFETPVSLLSGTLGYDNQQGYGRAILQPSLSLFSSGFRIRNIVFDRVQISNNQVHNIFIMIDSTNCDASVFSATITWADPPAVSGCVNCLLNNLDLTVRREYGDFRTYYGNGGEDYKNNVERARITDASNGLYSVTVTASNLAISPQKYSIVMAGCPVYKYRSGFNGQKVCPCPPDQACSYQCPQP